METMRTLENGHVREIFSLGVDDVQTLEGVHHPEERWNGFACPFLTLESMVKVQKWVSNCVANNWLDSEEGPVVTDDAVFWVMDDGQGMEIKPTFFGGVPYYNAGIFGWCFTVEPK